MNAQHLAGMGSNADDKIHPANATDDRKTAIVTPRREPLGGVTVALRFKRAIDMLSTARCSAMH
jgi:hypothetical protein